MLKPTVDHGAFAIVCVFFQKGEASTDASASPGNRAGLALRHALLAACDEAATNECLAGGIDGLRWIRTYGGPLIVLGSAALPSWRGTLERSPPSLVTDYERASAKMSSYISEIETGDHKGFVIGDVPMPTTVVEDGVTAIVSLLYAPEDFDVDARIAEELDLRTLANPASRVKYSPQEKLHFLFDAALAGDEVDETSISFELSPRPHLVETHSVETANEVAFLIHVVRPLNA